MIYVTVILSVRKRFGLSPSEYIVMDIIDQLSRNPRSKYPGWYYGSKEYLADIVGIDRRTIHRHIKDLIEKEILEKDENSSFLKTTLKWFEATRLNPDFKDESETKCLTDGDNLSPQNEAKCPTTIINKDNTKDSLFDNNSHSKDKNKKPQRKKERIIISLEESLAMMPTQFRALQEFDEVWTAWYDRWAKANKPLVKTTVEFQISRLMKYSDPIASIKQSLERQYTGIFEVNSNNNGKNNSNAKSTGEPFHRF